MKNRPQVGLLGSLLGLGIRHQPQGAGAPQKGGPPRGWGGLSEAGDAYHGSFWDQALGPCREGGRRGQAGPETKLHLG